MKTPPPPPRWIGLHLGTKNNGGGITTNKMMMMMMMTATTTGRQQHHHHCFLSSRPFSSTCEAFEPQTAAPRRLRRPIYVSATKQVRNTIIVMMMMMIMMPWSHVRYVAAVTVIFCWWALIYSSSYSSCSNSTWARRVPVSPSFRASSNGSTAWDS